MAKCYDEKYSNTSNPYWDEMAELYDSEENQELITLCDSVINRMIKTYRNQNSTDDVITFRLSRPKTGYLERQASYEDFTSGDGIRKIGIEFIKMTTKVNDSGLFRHYSYYNPVQMEFDTIMTKDGTRNLTGKTMYDQNSIGSLSKNQGSLPDVKYDIYGGSTDGISAISPVDIDGTFPNLISKILRNPIYNNIFLSDDYDFENYSQSIVTNPEKDYPAQSEKIENNIIMTTKGFYDRISLIKSIAIIRKSKFASNEFEKIKLILDEIGMGEAFEDLEFGGDIDGLKLVLRIPASRQNQDMLEHCINIKDGSDFITEWNNAFSVETISVSKTDVEENTSQLEHLLDPIGSGKTSTDDDDYSITYDLENVDGGVYGCSTKTYYQNTDENGDPIGDPIHTAYQCRYFVVNLDWMQDQTNEVAAIVFWAGLDLDIDQSKKCPYDQLITIIIIVVITYFTAGLGSTAAGATLTTSQYMAIAAMIINIGLTVGAFGNGAGARNVSILSALLTLGSINFSSFSGGLTSASLNASVQIASTALKVVETIDSYNHAKAMQKKSEEAENIAEDAEMYESDIRFVFGSESYEMPQDFLNTDPYDSIRMQYSDFELYKTKGFTD